MMNDVYFWVNYSLKDPFGKPLHLLLIQYTYRTYYLIYLIICFSIFKYILFRQGSLVG